MKRHNPKASDQHTELRAFKRPKVNPPVLRVGSVLTSPVLERRYKIERLLTQGGYGSVYRATVRIASRRRSVCVKVTSDLDSWHQEVHWFRVFQDDPRVIDIYDAFPLQGRRKWPAYVIIIEYAHRGALSDYIERQGKLDPAYTVSEVIGLLRTLEAFHRVGGIHRDITPDNVLACGLHGRPTLKFTDFGIAKQKVGEQERVEADAWNPGWMPSEVANERQYVVQSDLYQMGLVMCAMLTGSAEQRITDKAMLRDIPGPAALQGVLTKALESQPSQRYRDAAAMRRDLETVLAQLDVEEEQAEEPQDPETEGTPASEVHSLERQVVVFTGAFEWLSRLEATVLALQEGAEVRNRITKQTTLVVLGEGTGDEAIAQQTATHVLSQIDKLNQTGGAILLITEEEFLELAGVSINPGPGPDSTDTTGSGRKRKRGVA